jgi:ankyrin repeat protein
VPEVVRALVAAGCPLLGTELHYPVCRRDVATTHLLLGLGCPPDEPFGFNESDGPKKWETPLTTAVRTRHTDEDDLPELGLPCTEPQRLEVTSLLLAAGADPNRPGAKGLTPLSIAVGQRHLGLAEMLVGAGADPDFVPPGGKGKSPAALAAEKGVGEFVRLFSRDR